ncbi:hypothetical protein F0562_027344 [Nyssa sinensis]|uniref:NAC domain-containing protein n=1 Tax=Nyssa sinensis TaxID=561372 RepID=A0A5J5B5W7_9ASTE|nr:hypothetical protein F0562_027344 [Nyssa sinensis]
MCPPAPAPLAADISVYWTDEELCLSLAKIIRGSPLPGNVLADVNPYQHMPSKLPDGVWYFICSEQKKDTEIGSWKAKGEACEIFANAAITGWRTTLEFYEGQAPNGQKTDWIMQEYMISDKGLCENSKPKESGLLLRVFLSGERSPNHKKHHKQGGIDNAGRNHFHSLASVVPIADNTSGQRSTSESQVKNRNDAGGLLTITRNFQNLPVENLPENDYILRDDFLELDDLADPESPSSSSDNSSRLSSSADEYFNSVALLRDLGGENNQDWDGKDTNFKFSVSASVRPNEVVMYPVTLGSLVSSNGSKSATEETVKSRFSIPGSAIEGKFMDKRAPKHAIKSQKSDHRSEGPSNSHKATVSSSSHKAVPETEKKAVDGKMKKPRKEYLCFMPF